MNRLKLFATATLMALAFTACDEGTPPPVEPPPPPTPVGTISGAVTIEGTAASGVTATLSSGATTTTGSGGNFAFSGVEAGTYTVTISGYPEDATFADVTQSATIATDGQNVQLTFAGEYIRSSSVVGNVVAADAMMSGGDGQPETLAGVTVTLGGEHAMGETAETGMDGGFMFTGLRAGTYTVTISDYPEDVSFETVMVEVAVEVGQVGNADFTGHFIRTSAVEGQVIIEGEGLAGVSVTLSGGPAEEMYTMLTDADGMFRFEELRPGAYTVSIADFDPRDYEFAATSQDVSVDLDETGTVSFTGVLLRTSGISGRVSVEGMGLGDIEVTLAGGDDSRMAMTDAGGQYSFAGLAAGDYTVSIAVASDAYVFESMSSDVALGDDESVIVNFEGAHARTASVSGQLFIDEATKNDMHDEGEEAFPSPSMLAALQGLGIPLPPTLAVPITLVGPAVHEVRSGSLNVATGQYSFGELRAGVYQLQIGSLASLLPALPAPLAAVLQDFEYGGPGEGYAISVAAGEAATQNVPIDITHTTINVAVTLKGGDSRGMPIPGATVDLFSDDAGDTKIGGGTTGENGAASIRIARSGTSDNTVHMAVDTEDYFKDPTAGMQAVTWNPQSTVHPVPGTVEHDVVVNDADIVNLNVDVTVNGATVTTEYGGGEALGEWELSVTSGGEAVAGAPAELDTAGAASFTATVAPTDLPVSYSFNVADDQSNSLDGGENYEGNTVTHVHTGLTLAGTVDLDPIEVRYTTQTLRVYVHREVDQVFGLTGNIVGGDGGLNMQPGSAVVELEVEYEEGGRDHSFESDEWDADLNTQYRNDETVSGPNGDTLIMGHRGTSRLVVFRHLPADKDVFVSARVKDGEKFKVLDKDPHNDALDTFRNLETNGVVGGAFGAQGGFSPRVALCPLQEKNPQNFDLCSSFAIVSLHTVTGDVSMRDVRKERNGDGFEVDPADDPTFVPDFTVRLVPKEGENFGGEEVSFTTAEEDDDDTEDLNEEYQFEFEDVVSGAYNVVDPGGWGAPFSQRSGLDPLGSDGVHLTIRPTTRTFYGHVSGADGFAVDSVSVTVNGRSAMSDEAGRYIIKGISPVAYYDDDNVRRGGYIWSSAREGQNPVTDTLAVSIAANAPYQFDIDLTSVGEYATISGTVRASSSHAPIAGALVEVDYGDGKGFVAPINPNAQSEHAEDNDLDDDIYETGSDGAYSIEVVAQGLGGSVTVRVTKRGMSFVPGETPGIPAHAGSAVSGFDFTGFLHATIRGKVEAPGGGPLEDVTVTATRTDGHSATTETGRTGSFSLSVPFGTYTVEATLAGHNFTYPTAHPGGLVNTNSGQLVNMGTIKATTAGALNVSAMRDRAVDDPNTPDVDESMQQWGTTIAVTFDADAANVPDGYSDATYIVYHDAGADESTAVGAPTPGTGDDEGTWTHSFATPDNADGGDAAFNVWVVASATGTDLPDLTISSGRDGVVAVNPSPLDGSVSARRQETATSTEAAADGNFIQASWSAVTNDNSDFRVVALVESGQTNNTVWVVLQNAVEADDRSAVSADISSALSTNVAIPGGTGAAVTVSEEELAAAISIAVESVQGTPGANNEWKRSAPVSLNARATSGS